jgi:D-alanyl-D-alanine carboxypeptidase
LLAAGLIATLAVGVAVTSTAPADASGRPDPHSLAAAVLTRAQVTRQVKAAESLGAALSKSDTRVAGAYSRLEKLSTRANTLLATLSAARTAQNRSEAEATTQRARLAELGRQVQQTRSSLGQLASDSYTSGGGPLSDVAAVLDALTSPSPEQSTDSMSAVHYLINSHARLLVKLKTVQSAQVITSDKAAAASHRATVAAGKAARTKHQFDVVVTHQRRLLSTFLASETAQVRRAAGLRSSLLRSGNLRARTADRKLARALRGDDYKLLMAQSTRCGNHSPRYPNGRWPSAVRCGLFAAPGQSLRRAAAMSFNAMSLAYQAQSGSALCVTDSYRSYAEQVAVKRKLPGLAARPGTSKHGFGLAVDLCGGVQNFGAPAHRWMKRHAPTYGWFHPAWAEPSGGLPEPWHWEFAG